MIPQKLSSLYDVYLWKSSAALKFDSILEISPGMDTGRILTESVDDGAWLFLIGGLICLVGFGNKPTSSKSFLKNLI